MAYIIVDAFLLCALSVECFRYLQGANYRPQRGYFKVLLTPYYLVLLAVTGVAITVRFCALPHYIASILYGVSAITFIAVRRKSPLKYTKRICRMLIVQLALLFTASYFNAAYYCAAALPFAALLSLAVCLPFDLLIARHYIKRARKKLEKSGVTVVAVTGSYGKTSVKDMLTTLLDNSVSPQGSCNTPLGIASYINKTDFYYVKYLVLEFGARKKGDIAELCRLYKPTYGIVTGVCPQHLSTFKTFDNVIAAKRELVENLPEKGVCVLNSACSVAMSYADAGTCAKVASADGLQINVEKITAEGTRLAVTYRKTTKQILLPQITAYVGQTFAMCLKMCLTLKQSFTKTLSRAADIKQTPHRMQLIKAANCCIIDDSYNGSITGVQSAAETLSHFTQNKVVITQGLVECGGKKREMNVKCGLILGKACNVAIVSGANKRALSRGLQQTNCKVIFAKNVKQAVQVAQPYLYGSERSILFFQNDLPDY